MSTDDNAAYVDAQIGDPARETELVDQLLQGDVRRFRDGRLEMPK